MLHKKLPMTLTKKATVHFNGMRIVENEEDETVVQFMNNGEIFAEVIYAYDSDIDFHLIENVSGEIEL